MRRIVIAWIGTLASIGGLIYTLWPNPAKIRPAHAVLLGLASGGLLYLLGADLVGEYRRIPKRYKTAEAIKAYMYDWIAKGGRVVIFTRDMSWADDERVKSLLHNKARANELTICLPESIALTNELRRSGARIWTYPRLGFVPAARFTIVNDERMDARVAIGRQVAGVHTIEEYSAGEHPVFAVTRDLVDVVKRLEGMGIR